MFSVNSNYLSLILTFGFAISVSLIFLYLIKYVMSNLNNKSMNPDDIHKNMSNSRFIKLVRHHCQCHGWTIFMVRSRATEADLHIEKNGVTLIIVCLSHAVTKKGSGIALGKILSEQVLIIRRRYHDPVIFLYQKSISGLDDLHKRGLFVVTCDGLTNIMDIAIHGTPDNTEDGTWQRALILGLHIRCKIISEGYEKANNLPLAIEWAIHGAKAAPRNASPQIRLGDLYLKAGIYDEAERAALRSRALSPSSPDSLRLMSMVKNRLNDQKSAIEYAQKWVNMRSSQATAHEFLIKYLLKDSQYLAARYALQTALSMIPNHPTLLRLSDDLSEILRKDDNKL